MTEDLAHNAVITQLLKGLLGATTFEQVATLTLSSILDVAAAALTGNPDRRCGRAVRAMVHLRPGGTYRRLVVLEAGQSSVSAPRDRERPLFSASAWRWVVERREGIWVDVILARASSAHRDKGYAPLETQPPARGGHFASESRIQLMQRDVTHLLALPLRTPPDVTDGMVSIEFNCPATATAGLLPPDALELLQFVTDLAAPYLTTLPSKTSDSPEVDSFLPVVGKSMASTIEMLLVFAQQEEPILIGGPTGAGKSRLARWCHEHSATKDKPFEALDLSAVPEELQMAELFGWKRGAFTGAVRDNAGLIARARGGTLFIDEIGNLSARAQAGLLHVLEERTYRVLGDDNVEKSADVRFIIGTNENLQEAVRARRFREDLYYRINVLPVSLPALCDRVDEIPMWASYMVNRRQQKNPKDGPVTISTAAEAALMNEPWPGNLRQLDNIVRRAYAIAMMSRAGSPSRSGFVLEEEHIRRALAYEAPDEQGGCMHALLAAATALVNRAKSQSGGRGGVDLDLIDGFKGFVLGIALEKAGGNRDEVFRMFAREKLVANRNHHKVLRRELERAEQLFGSLGESARFPFAALIADSGDPGEKA